VNYIRRFDPLHRWFRGAEGLKNSTLTVSAKKDIHTVCHFTDLARFWHVPKKNLIYEGWDGSCSYRLSLPGGPEPWNPKEIGFPMGGVVGGFMEGALHNLLDAVEGKAALISPPESAVVSETWAYEILNGR